MDTLLLLLGISYAIFAAVGIVGNFIMILAFVFSTKLRSVCHFLISSLCLADLLHSISQIPNSITTLSQWEMKQTTCFFIQILPLIGAIIGSPICIVMGTDRFIAIAFPTFYHWIQQHWGKSLFFYFIFPVGYTTWLLWIAVETTSDTIVGICAIPTAMSPQSFALFTTANLIINSFVCIIYMASWILLKVKKVGKSFQRVFKSILITVLLIVFGWLTTVLINQVSFIWFEEEYTRIMIQMFAGFFVNTSICANVFVYYFRNAEYQEAILKVFGKQMPIKDSIYTRQGTTAPSES